MLNRRSEFRSCIGTVEVEKRRGPASIFVLLLFARDGVGYRVYKVWDDDGIRCNDIELWTRMKFKESRRESEKERGREGWRSEKFMDEVTNLWSQEPRKTGLVVEHALRVCTSDPLSVSVSLARVIPWRSQCLVGCSLWCIIIIRCYSRRDPKRSKGICIRRRQILCKRRRRERRWKKCLKERASWKKGKEK